MGPDQAQLLSLCASFLFQLYLQAPAGTPNKLPGTLNALSLSATVLFIFFEITNLKEDYKMRTYSMFHKPAKLLATGGLLLAAALLGQSAFAQTSILNSKHDLSSASTTSGAKTVGTTEVCVFCHTPHGGSSSAPLWNRGVAATATFNLYTSNSMDGSAIQPNTSGSGLCLSCHDGATALDLLINAPGSGYGAGTGAAVTQGWVFSGGSTGSKMLSTSIANLSSDLTNDHPIGIPYCGGANVSNVCKDPDFKTAALMKMVAGSGVAQTNPTAAAGQNWWIDVISPSTTRVKGDLPLYVRDFSGTSYPSVACATCHEPHGSGFNTFLRMSNASSALCLTCHNK